ncbi:MAG: deoxyribose-phosphate aldolase [Brevinema sp.]
MTTINSYIDHTLLKPEVTTKQIIQLCNEALQHQFYAVCINGYYIPLAKQLLKDSPIKIAAVAGFPLGAMSFQAKITEIQHYINTGADEIDIVINIGMLKDKKYALILDEIRQIKLAMGTKLLKVIIETCLLTQDEIQKMCHIIIDSGAEYIKTSTGFSTGGAIKEDLELMLHETQGKILVKAAGGIKDQKTALEYINMGVMRLGTSSGVALVNNSTNPSLNEY